MKRETLKELGLSEEQMYKIMAANGADIEKAKSGLGDVEALKTENESLKEQLTGRDKDLKSLQKQAGNSEELTKQLEDLQNQYKTDTEALQGQLHQTKLNGALDTVLSGAKVRNAKAAKALLDMDKIELTDNGDLKGVDDQLSALKQSDAYLFDEGSQGDYKPGGGEGPQDTDPAQAMIDAFKN